MPDTIHILMPLGPSEDATRDLATLFRGVTELQPFSVTGLKRAIKAGRDCVVVWAGPHIVLEQALRTGAPPSLAAKDWIAKAQDLLDVAAQYAHKLVLVDSAVVTRADAAGMGKLHDRLPLNARALPAQAPDLPDITAVLAHLIAPQLAEVQPVVQRLKALSITTAEQPPQMADLDHLGALLADRSSLAIQDNATEIALLQSQLQYLQSELEAAGPRRAVPVPGADQVSPDIEAAFATLLSEVVAETEARILAQQEVLAARQTLRAHGITWGLPLGRVAVPPRPRS